MLSLIINVSGTWYALTDAAQPRPDLDHLRRRFIRDLERYLQSHLNASPAARATAGPREPAVASRLSPAH